MLLKQAIETIREALHGVYDDREVQAMTRIICEDVFHYDPVDVQLRQDSELPDFAGDRLTDILTRLQHHEPLQYIMGHARFHGHEFKVTPDTLIPRPETEQLVDMIIDENSDSDLRVLDIGTGCGCIAISLARALRFAQVDAMDISREALQVAADNAVALKVSRQVRTFVGDILSPQPAATYDIIVSNPPYVCQSERTSMERNVTEHEPSLALFVPDDDPLRYYNAIVPYAADALASSGRLYLEINHRFPNEVASLLQSHGFTSVNIVNDSYGKPRFATATHS